MRLWAAIPAVLTRVNSPPTHAAYLDREPILNRHWLYAEAFVAANPYRFAVVLFLARVWMVPISCLAGWVTYRWAGRLYGPRSATAACAMYCLNPSILANGALVTTDIGTTAAILASCWLWWRFCRSPSWPRWMLACVAVLAAHLCKFTALLLWPMLLSMTLPFIQWRLPRRRWLLPGAWALMAVATILLLNAVYGFRETGRPIGAFTFDSYLMQRVQRSLPAGFPTPLPRLLVDGFDAQKTDTQSGYQGFLFGEVYQGAKWYYFPAALLCKLPIAMLLLFAAAMASRLGPRGTVPPARRAGEQALFLAFAVFAAGVMLLGDINIGTRYLLPAFPLAIILISRIWSIDRPASAKTRPLFPYLRDALLALLALETLWVCPRFITFVNFAVGGPSNGWRLLSDSDYDWGQGLIDLHDWMRDNQVPSIGLAYFGAADPRAYGVQFTSFVNPGNARFIAVSSYFLDGLEHRIQVDPTHWAWFSLRFYRQLQTKTPVAVAGHTIFIYSLPDVDSAASEAPPGP